MTISGVIAGRPGSPRVPRNPGESKELFGKVVVVDAAVAGVHLSSFCAATPYVDIAGAHSCTFCGATPAIAEPEIQGPRGNRELHF